jgi:predicted amidohydrolase
MVVDPWGRIIAKVEEGSKGFSIVNLSKQHIQNVRDQIPMSQHRRLMI